MAPRPRLALYLSSRHVFYPPARRFSTRDVGVGGVTRTRATNELQLLERVLTIIGNVIEELEGRGLGDLVEILDLAYSDLLVLRALLSTQRA